MLELGLKDAMTENARMVHERDQGFVREVDLTKRLKNLEKADVERRGQEMATLVKECQHERALKEQERVERGEEGKRHRQELQDKKTDLKQMETRMARLQQEVDGAGVLSNEWEQQVMVK